MELGKQRILFLCTGNYYRSRFAEMLFNHLARAEGLAWQATSRGLALERGAGNMGPMSMTALIRLRQLGIPIEADLRLPRHLSEDELADADLVIALKEAEHRPLLSAR